MKDEERNILVDNLEKIWFDDTFKKLFINSISTIKPTPKRSVILLFVFVCIYIFYITVSVKVNNAVDSTREIVNTINSFIIPVFAVIITGYSIFQALTNGRTLLALLKANENEKSKFQEYNYFFFSISILYLIIIILNFILSILLNNIPNSWYIKYFSIEANNKLFAFLTSIYLVFIFNSLVEMKSFIYNLYQVFSANSTANAIDFLDKEKS